MDEVTTMSGVESVPQPLGPRLRVARENAGLTQAELGRRVGVTVHSIEAWENDKHAPRANRMQTLAGVLHVSLSWLLEGRENAFMETQEATTIDAARTEFERLDTTLGEAKAVVGSSRARLKEISLRTRRGKSI